MVKVFILGIVSTVGGGLLFLLGYYFGETREIIVYKDAPISEIVQNRDIGKVAGTESAKLVENENLGVTVKKSVAGSDLLGEINMYRKSHDLPELNRDNELCVWVGKRIEELKQKGSLDDHAGFQAQSQNYLREKRFTQLAENIAQGQSTIHEVINSWAGSLAHQNTLLTQEMNRACAVFKNGFAVLITGRK